MIDPMGTMTINDVETNNIQANGASQVTVNDNLVVTGNLTVNGSLNYNPFFCAARVDGATLSQLSSIGRVGYTVVRPSGQATGIWNIVFNSPAPNNYVVSLTNMNFGTIYLWDQSPPTVNGLTVVIVNNAWSLRNAPFHFAVFV